MQFIAHRAGNDVETLRAAVGVADFVECDVHAGEGDRAEVRHAKQIWPTGRLWERWYLLPAATETPHLRDVLVDGHDVGLWVDLKGVARRLPIQVRGALAETGRPLGAQKLTVSSKSWWLLRSFVGADARTIRSAGNRFELLLMLFFASNVDGSVLHRRLLTPRVHERLRLRGDVFVWAVTSVDDAVELARRGVTGIIVDDIDLIPAARDRIASEPASSSDDSPDVDGFDATSIQGQPTGPSREPS
jgi:glycerophosphoryl diester phosphodiesterase